MAHRERVLGRRIRINPALLAVALAVALGIAALRIDLIRVRYGLADALSEEKALLEKRREAVAHLRALRDPARLTRLASEYGLIRPARIIDLPLLPKVSEAPPADTRARADTPLTPGDAR
jgi:hypothetical protein